MFLLKPLNCVMNLLQQKLVYLECGALVNFLQMYASIPNHHLIMKILLSLKTIQERIDLVLDMTFGRVLVR